MTLRRILQSILLLGTGLLPFAPAGWCQGATGRSANTAATPVARTADIEKAVALLCQPKDIIRSKDGKVTGCKVCPEGTQFRSDGPMSDHWGLYGATFGHFTSPTDDNLLISGASCDSHSMNWGGTFLFTLKLGRPRLVRYDMGLITDSCHKFTLSSGRDFLVCKGGWTGQGEDNSYVFSAVFDASGEAATDFLFSTRDTGGTCGDPDDTKVRVTDIKDVQFTSKDSGLPSGITITATLGDITCARLLAKRDPGKLPAGVKTYKVEFAFDGKKFQVTPASKATLKLFDSN